MTEIVRPQDKLREKAADARDTIADVGHRALETVQEKFGDVKELAAEKYAAGKDKLVEYEESLMRAVHAAPIKSVLIAAGVGVVLGFLWRRR